MEEPSTECDLCHLRRSSPVRVRPGLAARASRRLPTVGRVAHYVATVRSPRQAREAFDLVSDMRTFADWDPGIRSVAQVDGQGPGPGAVFDVRVAAFPLDLTLRYTTERYHTASSGPSEVLLVGRSMLFTSVDLITVSPTEDGSLVRYDADLRLAGPLRLGDLALRPVFGWVGARAESGLRTALAGESVRA